MNKENFIEIMERAQTRYWQRENYMDKLEEFFGMKIIEELYETDFLSIIVDCLEYAFPNSSPDIGYLVYDCEFDLNIFCEKIETKEGHPVIKDFGGFYDFINS